MNASPILIVRSSFSLIISSTSGKLTSERTLGSHVCFSSSFASASPLSVLFCFVHRAACTISSG
jgi:hypothetical protein